MSIQLLENMWEYSLNWGVSSIEGPGPKRALNHHHLKYLIIVLLIFVKSFLLSLFLSLFVKPFPFFPFRFLLLFSSSHFEIQLSENMWEYFLSRLSRVLSIEEPGPKRALNQSPLT